MYTKYHYISVQGGTYSCIPVIVAEKLPARHILASSLDATGYVPVSTCAAVHPTQAPLCLILTRTQLCTGIDLRSSPTNTCRSYWAPRWKNICTYTAAGLTGAMLGSIFVLLCLLIWLV